MTAQHLYLLSLGHRCSAGSSVEQELSFEEQVRAASKMKIQRDPFFLCPSVFPAQTCPGGRAGELPVAVGHSAKAERNGPRLIMSYATYAAAAAEWE